MPLTKSKFRQNCLQKIKSLPKHNKLYRTKKLNSILLEELKGMKNKQILFYYPLNFEANILDVLKKIRINNSVYLPFMVEESFKMVPFRLPLRKKKFDIYEAGNSMRKIKKVDIAIVPVIGVDGNFQRVGFGKGMYDRFFARLKKKPYTIFVQSELCHTKEYICDEFDISCNTLITSKTKKDTKVRINRGR